MLSLRVDTLAAISSRIPGNRRLAPHRDETNVIQVPLDTLDNMQRELIRAVVERCGGNKSRAALLMDVSRNTIHQRMKGATKKGGSAAAPFPETEPNP